MEPSCFDDLTKALATATSRRQALKAIAATVGGLLGLGGVGTALANCKPNGIGCNIGSQCCSGACCHGTCTNLGTTSNCGSCGNTCGANQVCQNGTCVTPCTTSGGTCGGDTECCSGTCCQGTCCGSGQVCLSNGSCATPCSDQAVPCSGSCGQGVCLVDSSDVAIYCRGSGAFISDCTTDSTCPKGYFCSIGGGCVPLC